MFQKIGSVYTRTEYRINKKGCEMFRTSDYQKAKEKLDSLSAKRPGIYTMQSRSCRCNKYGTLDADLSGKNTWTPWF